MFKMLIMGPAGAGKGTMSELICENYQIPHISTGDMFRQEIKQNTLLGQQANEFILKGLLVPDNVTIAMVKNRLSKEDCKDGYLLDGFPRSLPQAVAIDDLSINVVLNLVINEEALVERIVNRRVCRNCGDIYNITTKPSLIENVCDECGGELYQRSDDTYEKLMVRLDAYRQETQAAIEHYRQQGIVYDINANQSIESEFNEIKEILASVKGGMSVNGK